MICQPEDSSSIDLERKENLHDHAVSVLECIEVNLRRNQFADVLLFPGAQLSHRLLLSSASKFLCRLLQDQGESEDETVLIFPGVTQKEMESLVTFLYTGQLETRSEGIVELLRILEVPATLDTTSLILSRGEKDQTKTCHNPPSTTTTTPLSTTTTTPPSTTPPATTPTTPSDFKLVNKMAVDDGGGEEEERKLQMVLPPSCPLPLSLPLLLYGEQGASRPASTLCREHGASTEKGANTPHYSHKPRSTGGGRQQQQHEQQQQQEHQQEVEEERYYRCPQCSLFCVSLAALASHSQNCGGPSNQEPENNKAGSTSSSSSGKKSAKGISCPRCLKTFRWRSDYKAHAEKEHGVKVVEMETCPFCNKDIVARRLKEHIKNVHTDDRPLGCDLCEKRFHKPIELKNHKRVHTGEKPFTCTVCGAAFQLSHILKRHMRYHRGEKKYVCSHCPKSFLQRHDLDKHTRCHTGDKPFKCPECDASFARNDYLKKHRALHPEGSSCPVCQQLCGSQELLSKHIKARHGTKTRDLTLSSSLSLDIGDNILDNILETGGGETGITTEAVYLVQQDQKVFLKSSEEFILPDLVSTEVHGGQKNHLVSSCSSHQPTSADGAGSSPCTCSTSPCTCSTPTCTCSTTPCTCSPSYPNIVGGEGIDVSTVVLHTENLADASDILYTVEY